MRWRRIREDNKKNKGGKKGRRSNYDFSNRKNES